MADVTFAQVEAALVTRLDDQITYLAKCASYAGQIEAANDGLPVEAPACFVIFEGFERDGDSSSRRQHVGWANFAVLVVADSFDGGATSRTKSEGAYEIIDDVIAALDDYAAVTGFEGCEFRGIEMVKVDKIRAMYKVRFAAPLVVTR